MMVLVQALLICVFPKSIVIVTPTYLMPSVLYHLVCKIVPETRMTLITFTARSDSAIYVSIYSEPL